MDVAKEVLTDGAATAAIEEEDEAILAAESGGRASVRLRETGEKAVPDQYNIGAKARAVHP
jgi:hypothetical protein